MDIAPPPRKKSPKGRSKPAQSPTASGALGDWLGVAAVALVASVAGIRNSFAFDDISLIPNDERVTDLTRWASIFTTSYWPPPFAHELYRPLATLLLAIEYAVGAGAPLVFRLTSYGLYAAAAIGVYAVGRRFLPRTIALGVALLFAADPLHVEAVALGVNQGELIVAIAGALMLCRYVDARRRGAFTTADWSVIAASYAAAVLVKENAFILPAMLVATDAFAESTGSLREWIVRMWKGYGVLGVIALAALAVRAAVLSGSVSGALPAEALQGLSGGGRLLTMLTVVPQWVRLLAWPQHLQADYSPNEIVASTSFGILEATGLLIVLSVTFVVVWMKRRAPVVSLGLVCCGIALFPVSNVLVPTGIVLAERTLFLPSVGFALAVGGVADYLLRSLPQPDVTRSILATACVVLVALGVIRSERRQSAWRNAAHLWAVTAQDAPKSLRVKRAHVEAVADLRSDFERRIATSPSPWMVRRTFSALLRAMGEDTAAVEQLRLSLAERADQPEVRLDLGASLLTLGSYAEAKRISSDSVIPDSLRSMFQRIGQLADSAARVNAPVGSVRVGTGSGQRH